jgi:hypothetical protein
MPNDAEETQFEPLYARSINVQADRVYQTKRVLLGNWQWLIVTLLLPFVGYLRKHLKRKPKETELLP